MLLYSKYHLNPVSHLCYCAVKGKQKITQDTTYNR